MKCLFIVFLVLAVFLTACQATPEEAVLKQDDDYSLAVVSEPQAEEDDDSPFVVGEPPPGSKRNPFAPYPPMPGEEQMLDPEFWLRYHLPLTIHATQPNFVRKENNKHFSAIYSHVTDWLAITGHAQNYITAQDEAIISFEEFFFIAGRFFGEKAVLESIEAEREQAYPMVEVNWQEEAIRLYYHDHRECGWFLKHMSITDITQLVRDGVQMVQIEMNRYEVDVPHTPENIFRHETYLFAWDEAVGFVVEESSWRWPETDQVRIEGNVQLFETLWGVEGIGEQSSNNMPEGAPMVYWGNSFYNILPQITIGNSAYRVFLHGNELLYNSFNFATGQQQTAQLIYSFGNERVLSIVEQIGMNGFFVYTDATAYRFDESLSLATRQAWPATVDIEHLLDTRNRIAVSDDLTLLAYSYDVGLYIVEMNDTATPRRIRQGRSFEEAGVELQIPFPIRFLDDSRILSAYSVWEATSTFRVIDLQGNIIGEMPFTVSGAHGGGTAFLNERMMAFFPLSGQWPPPDDWPHIWLYDFNNNTLERLPWLEQAEISLFNAPIPDPSNPMVWYCTYGYPQSSSEVKPTDKVAFHRLDFESGTITELPLAVIGADANLLAVGANGELLFAYAFKGERGFGVYFP